jgi:hypothetical protein
VKHPIHPSCVCVRAHLSVDALGSAPNKKVKRGLVITTISDKNLLGNSPLSRTFRFEHRGEARTHTRLPQHGRTLSSTRAHTQRISSVCDSARGCPAAMSKHPEQQQDATDSAGQPCQPCPPRPAQPALPSCPPSLPTPPTLARVRLPTHLDEHHAAVKQRRRTRPPQRRRQPRAARHQSCHGLTAATSRHRIAAAAAASAPAHMAASLALLEIRSRSSWQRS